MKQLTNTANDFFNEVHTLLPWSHFAQLVLEQTDNQADANNPEHVADMVQSIKFYFVCLWYKIDAEEGLHLVRDTHVLQAFLAYNPSTDAPLELADYNEFITYIRNHKLGAQWKKLASKTLKKQHLLIKPGKVQNNLILEHPTVWKAKYSYFGGFLRVVLSVLPFVLFVWFILTAYSWHTTHPIEEVEQYDILITRQEDNLKAEKARLDAMKAEMDAMEAALTTIARNDAELFNERINEFNAFVKKYNAEIDAFNGLEQEYKVTVKLREQELQSQMDTWFLTAYIKHLQEEWFGAKEPSTI